MGSFLLEDPRVDNIENRRITSEQETKMEMRIKTMMIQVRPEFLHFSSRTSIRFHRYRGGRRRGEFNWNHGLLTRHFVISDGV